MTATFLTICIPTLAVLLSILLHRNDTNRLDRRIIATSAEMKAISAELRVEIAAIHK